MSEADNISNDQFEGELILANEVGRSSPSPPVFQGFILDIQVPKFYLWWSDKHRKSRVFSDAFVTQRGELAMIVSEVTALVDATGRALSTRAFLRGRIAASSDLLEVFNDFDHWCQNEPQWNGMLSLGIAILQQNRQFEFACRGNVSFTHISKDGDKSVIENSSTMPFLSGTAIPGAVNSVQSYSIARHEKYIINVNSENPVKDREHGSSPAKVTFQVS